MNKSKKSFPVSNILRMTLGITIVYIGLYFLAEFLAVYPNIVRESRLLLCALIISGVMIIFKHTFGYLITYFILAVNFFHFDGPSILKPLGLTLNLGALYAPAYLLFVSLIVWTNIAIQVERGQWLLTDQARRLEKLMLYASLILLSIALLIFFVAATGTSSQPATGNPGGAILILMSLPPALLGTLGLVTYFAVWFLGGFQRSVDESPNHSSKELVEATSDPI